MKLIEHDAAAGPRFALLLDVETAAEVAARIGAAVTEGAPKVQGSPYKVIRDGDGIRIDVRDGAALAGLLDGFVPGGTRLAADHLAAGGWGDYCEVHEHSGKVTVLARWVGDASSGDEDGSEPHEVTYETYRRFSERAAELGYEAEMDGHDHDTAEMTLRVAPSPPDAAWSPGLSEQVLGRAEARVSPAYR